MQRALGAGERLVVGLGELERRVGGEQLAFRRPFRRPDRLAAVEAPEHGLLAAPGQPEMSVDAEIDDRGGEAAGVVRHALDVAHGRGRHAVGRPEQGNDRAGRRIAADPPPREGVERHDADKTETRDRRRQIVLQPPAGLLGRARRRDEALLPCGRDGEAVSRRQCAGRPEHDLARLPGDDRGVLASRALRSGVERGLPERHRLGQRDARLGDIDRERPAGAGGVPVELVVIREEADLPGGAVADDELVRAGRQHRVGAADPHAHAVRHRLGGPAHRPRRRA